MLRGASRARAPTAARSGPATPSSPGPATRTTRGAYVGAALAAGAAPAWSRPTASRPSRFDDERIAALAGAEGGGRPDREPLPRRAERRGCGSSPCTGTNGKTSTAWWIAQALTRARAALRRHRHARHRRAAVGGRRRTPRRCPATGLTTPDPVALQARAARASSMPASPACAIEASSIGIAEHRLDGTPIDVALFTNFTQDHLDYHGDMDAYWAGQGAAVRLARPARRGDQHRRPAGRWRWPSGWRRRRRSTSGRARAAMQRACRRRADPAPCDAAWRSTCSKGRERGRGRRPR